MINPIVTLNNGTSMPVLGLGVYQISKGVETEKTVLTALELGYRLIDTAAFYGNEKDVGNAVRKSGIPRNEIFITTKLSPTTIFGVERALDGSLNRLGMDYVDLHLIHWPFLRKKTVWRTLEKAYKAGKARAIGVSNYGINDIENILSSAEIIPAVNQIEFHPFLYQKRLLEHCTSKGIVVEAHSPLTHNKRLNDPRILSVAQKYNKSAAQILIRWSLQHGLVVIPKTTKKERLQENMNVFDFEIIQTDMLLLDHLNDGYHAAWLAQFTKNDP